jgi:signal transduction histidine kinase
VGGFLYVWVSGIILQSEQRRELIRQLRETQEELARSERKAGILSERQRLAGEIHDTLAQGFTSIVMLLEAAEAIMPDEHPALEYLEQARRTGRESLEQARRLVWELRPQALEHASIADALKRTLFNWAHDTGLEVEFNQTGENLNLHPQVEITLLRTLQEALANVRKHARASRVSITLSFIGGLVVLDVQDDGEGFVPDDVLQAQAAPSHGYGLIAMRERLAKVNGRQIVESPPGGGTTLVVQIPVAE